jgi:hypothetical protein
MRTFKVFLLVISAAFVIVSCGSSTTSTSIPSVTGLNAPSQIKVL